MSDYISKVKALNLPEGHYMITGSAILEILGIRKAKDIDILVSPELFVELESKRGWVRNIKYPTTIDNLEHTAGAKQSLDFMKENYSLRDVLAKATIIDKIPFMGLEMLLNAKKQLGREKDLNDIKLIEYYFANK